MRKLCLCPFLWGIMVVSAHCQTTTVTAESSNNTSASSTFAGFTDFRTNDSTTTPIVTLGSPLETNPFDPAPRNISKVNVHSLMYPGFNGKILVETQTWFCSSANNTFSRNYSSQNSHSFSQCNEHLAVGYDSDDGTHANAAIDDTFSRGFDGFIADVAGGQNNCRTGTGPSGTPASFTFTTPCPAKVLRVDNAVQAMMGRINGTYPTQLQFMLMEDQSAFDGGNNCGTADVNQPLCIEQKIESDISYYNSTYFFTNPNTYLKNAGAPFVAFFIAEEHQGTNPVTNLPNNPIDLSQCDGGSTACVLENGTTCGGTFVNSNQSTVSNCWTAIWDAIRAHAPVPITMIFRNKPGFTHEQSDGSFQWVDANPATGSALTTQTQEDITNGTEVDNFYSAAKTSGKIAFGIVKKGFDREDAPFADNPLGSGHVTSQECGQTWLSMFNKINSNFSAANQIPFVIAGTWDDYEEGTEIETGIGNCITTLESTGPNGAVSWGVPSALANTIHHYAVYSSTDGQNLSLMKDNISCPSGNCSVDLLPLASTLPTGTYTFFLKSVGQPSIVNRLEGFTETLPDFALRWDQSGIPTTASISTRPANSDTFTLTWTTNLPNFNVSPTTLAAGASATVTPNIPPGEGTWNLSMTATDTRTGVTNTLTGGLIILGNPSFHVPIVQPSSATVTAGSATTVTANESTTSGFNSPITLSASGLPAGADASFNPATLPSGSGSSQLTLSTSSSTPAGTYTLTISASDGGFIQNQSFTLTVNAPPPPPPPGGGGCTGRNCLNQ
jgi:hypothetical protein